uniref:Uncharacterized protein n=1 Tax=Panagrolaimus superbus TaxID=310955 RepID=A0A914Y628_9BILA
MSDGRRQKVVEKQSSANKTSKHIIFTSDDDDDEDDSGLEVSVLQNTSDVQQKIDKRLIANKKKSTVDQTQTEVSANQKSKHTTFTSDDDSCTHIPDCVHN